MLPYDRLYGGCRSWVPLRQAVDEATLATAVPALPEGPFAAQREAVRAALSATGAARQA